MDKIPPGAGMPGGAGVDGAFERFLTAAIATIITIMFSWRLLAEEEEAMGIGATAQGTRAPRPFSLPSNYSHIAHKTTTHILQQPTVQRSTSGICEIDISDDESSHTESRSTDVDRIERELVVYDQCSPEQQQQLGATMTSRCEDTSMSSVSTPDDSLTVDTLTTWDEYKWEEETGQEEVCVIKTRRSVRDFVKNQNSLSPNTSNASQQPVSESPLNKSDKAVSHTVPFSQRFADFVPDAGGDSGYIDLYPDVESDSDVTDSSDDERVYEIQVSDSDSDSEDLRNGGFYGVTSLDTIMEEYESDVSETSDVDVKQTLLEHPNDVRNAEQNTEKTDVMPVSCKTVRPLSSSNTVQENDKICDNFGGTDDKCVARCGDSSPRHYTETDIDTCVSSKPDTTVTQTNDFSSPKLLSNTTDDRSICHPVISDTLFSSSEASRVECDLPLDRTSSSDENTTKPVSLMGKTLQSESTVNHDRPVHTAVNEIYEQSHISLHDVSPNSQEVRENENITLLGHEVTDKNSSISKPKIDSMKLKLSSDEYKISEISDDSLPPSPVRTCALDSLAEEPFSDTESCSSGSVITVLSIKSNDSDNRTSDKMKFFPVSKGDSASGKIETPLLPNDRNTDSMSKYDNFSLVSGFLNDSLNSLLSANTGSEVGSSSDLESSSPEVVSQREQTAPGRNVQVNGKVTSDDSNVSSNESLPLVQEHVHINEEIPVTDNINGHTTSSDSLNNMNEQFNFESNEPIPDYVDSDASSDSSDPPLREYDPRDDDLAAFQFNLDSDDDSFYLVIGGDSDDHDDEGKLRNFDTFTNLNSVGLTSDYGDAVTSRTLSDDGKSFTFSHTEDIDTQFRKRGYFTDRDSITDSPGRGPLSPITSEDEETKTEEVAQTGNENEIVPMERVINLKAYEDAEISVPSKETRDLRDSAIDFNKYIIKSDLSPITQNLPEFPAQNRWPSATVDGTKPDMVQSSLINTEGDKMNNFGEKTINNSQPLDGQVEILSNIPKQSDRLSETVFVSGHVDTSDAQDAAECLEVISENVPKYDDLDLSSEDKIDKSDLKKIETNIDDLFDFETAEKTGRLPDTKVETLIDDIFDTADKSSYKNEIVETSIDDLVTSNTEVKTKTKFKQPKTIKRSHRRSTPLKATNSKVETNIDDIFTDSTTNDTQTRVKVETNIDDIFEPELVSETSSQQRKETNFGLPDVVCDVKRNVNADVKLETCFDVTPDINSDIDYGDFVHKLSSQADGKPEITSESAITGASGSIKSEKGVHVENDQIYGQNEKNNCPNTDIDEEFSLSQDAEWRLGQKTANSAISDTDRCIDNTTDNVDIQTIRQRDLKPHSVQTINDNYPQSSVQYDSLCGFDGKRYDTKTSENIETETIERELETQIDLQARRSVPDNELEKNNTRLLVSDLNSSHTDDNAAISVPKNRKLNNVRNSSTAGSAPGDVVNRSDSIPDRLFEEQTAKTACTDLNYDLNSGGISFHDVDTSGINQNDSNNSCETELIIVEDNLADYSADEKQLDSIGSCSLSAYSDDESLSSFEESYNNIQATYNAIQANKLKLSSDGRVVRTPLTKPSELFGKSKDLKGVQKRIRKHQLKKYTSVLQQPITSEKTYVHVELPERPASVSRLHVQKSRERFLSEENLSSDSFENKFLQHRTSLVASTPRKYLKRHERELQSTESLPADMSIWNASYDSNASMDHMHRLPVSQRIDELYHSRYGSHNSSFERSEYAKLHANCMFSPEKRAEIQHTTKSLENMFEQLLRYGSVSSVAETDLDAPDIQDPFISFQYPLERAASMSALVGSSETTRAPKKTGKGRFAHRKVPKSKSLQTLETNLDDVFASELEHGGELKKTPSVHELRVSNSLSKLNVPDWFKKSSFSRAGSTQSLFTYAGRTGSTSTLGSHAYPPSLTSSPTPSVTPGANTVIIQKRVTPSPTTPTTSKLLRAPMLPTTPERAPIHDIPSATLPSDKYRKQDNKGLKPITILPFAKIREMFEKKAQQDRASATSPVTSPTREKPSPTKEKPSPTKERPPRVHFDPSEIPAISEPNDHTPVQNNRTTSPPPPLPERRPILTDTSKQSDNSNSLSRKQQVHFSDEKKVSKPQEQNVDSKRQNGSTPSTSSSTVKKPSGLRASLPLPQFRFRRPGSYATKVAASNTQKETTQSKKGKPIDFYEDYGDSGEYQVNNDNSIITPPPAWLHALELKAKTDGETLFEFLQKRRYSSILENGFAEQLEELQDKDVTFNFPVMAISNHSSHGDMLSNGSPDLCVVLTNAHNLALQDGYLNNKLHSDAPVDDILDGLLLLDGHQTGRMRLDENGRIVPKSPDDFVSSPDTPPGYAFLHSGHVEDERVYSEGMDSPYGPYDIQSEYILVRCENPQCNRETNLKEARKYFKSCHSCFTYYCSKTCRKNHWSPHKLVCVYSRINSACKHVIKCINKQSHLQYQCSRIARRGYLSQGRGCVVFAFPDIGSAEDFLTSGMESLWVPPVYISIKELSNAAVFGSQLHILTETCKQYNPELKYVIHVAIVIPPQLPYRPVPRRMEAIIQKCAKLRLSPAHMHPKQEDSHIPSTLILTAVPGNQHADDTDGRKTRELCFVNIQRKLRHRGVSLRHQFPDVYNKLIDFVADAKHFSPLIIYPIDNRSGKRFMCVIMPEAQPEIEWIRDPDLFHELDVFEDEDTETSTPSYTIQHEVML